MILLILNHPLSLGFILIVQTILVSILLGLFSQTFWFTYILFLVIIGGILILFIYVISLISNKIIKKNFNFQIFGLLIFVSSLIIIFKNSFLTFNNYEILPTWDINILFSESSINLLKLYNFPINLINILIIIYLFFLLIVVVKITNFFYGPLRIKI